MVICPVPIPYDTRHGNSFTAGITAPIAYLLTEDFAIDMRKVSYRGSYGERCGE